MAGTGNKPTPSASVCDRALVDLIKAQRRLERSPHAASTKLVKRIAREWPDLRRLMPDLTPEQIERRKALMAPSPGLAEAYRRASEQADLEIAAEDAVVAGGISVFAIGKPSNPKRPT